MNLKLLRTLTVVLPILFLAATDLLRHTVFYPELHTFPGFFVTYGAIAAGVVAFSWAVFRAIGRLQGEILEQNRRLAALNRVAGALAENVELKRFLETALDSVLETMRVEAGVICTVDQEREELSAVCHRGISDTLARRIQRAKLGDDPIGGAVVRTGRPIVMERIFEHADVGHLARSEGIRSALSVPLHAQGRVTGVLAIASRADRPFSAIEVELLTNLGNQLGMAIRNSVLYEKAQRTNDELTTLLAVGRAAGSSLDLDQLLNQAMGTLLEMTEYEAAEVWVVEGAELAMRLHRGALPAAFLERDRFALGEGFPGIVAQRGAPLITHDLTRDERFLRQQVKEAEFQTFGAWPLVYQGKTLGVLAVASLDPEALTQPGELRLLEGIAEHLSIAIENARLHQQVQDAAILEERERIAHEMHDSLAQVLGYINTQVLALRKMLVNNSADQAMRQLSEMQDAVQQLYADVREGILGLRSAPGSSVGLERALEEYLERYRSMASFQVVLEVSPEARQLRLPHSSEVQLMRIIQEALSNIRKHARATQATVRLAGADSHLRVEVSDNGAGFDPSARPSTGWPRFGLQTMRERAESVGGKFSLESTPGTGTSVVVALPATHE